MIATQPKPKACKHCSKEFQPRNSMQVVCGKSCALRLVTHIKRSEMAKHRTRKEAIKTIPTLIKEAQHAFNAYIRERDKDKGCFVCGKPFPANRAGGSFDAGHVRSRGAAGHLRFNELNCHGECKECNSSFGAKPHQIKAGAINRIGLEAYEALESNNGVHKWTADELRAIKATNKAKLKALEQTA